MINKLLSTVTVIAISLALGGCGGSGTSTATTSTTAMTESTMSTTGHTMDEAHLHVAVKDGKVSGDTKPTVKLGSKVMIHITSDKADEAHLHGYDKEIELTAGKEAMITFTADIAGRFEFELHHSGLKAMELTVE